MQDDHTDPSDHEQTSPPPPPPAPDAVPPRSPEAVAAMPFESTTVEPEPRNTLGIVAFIASLAGFCVPVLPSAFAFVLGLFALRRRPRGFAIAAVVLALIPLVMWVVLFVALFVAPGRIGGSLVPRFQTRGMAQMELRRLLRSDDVELALRDPANFVARDEWGTPLRVDVIHIDGKRTILIWSAGADGAFDTDDDFVAASDPRDAGRKMGKKSLQEGFDGDDGFDGGDDNNG